MKIKIKFRAPTLIQLLAGEHSEEEIEQIQRLCSMFFHRGVPDYLLVSFDIKRGRAEVVLPQKEQYK